eukprot:gene21156-25409_t
MGRVEAGEAGMEMEGVGVEKVVAVGEDMVDGPGRVVDKVVLLVEADEVKVGARWLVTKDHVVHNRSPTPSQYFLNKEEWMSPSTVAEIHAHEAPEQDAGPSSTQHLLYAGHSH